MAKAKKDAPEVAACETVTLRNGTLCPLHLNVTRPNSLMPKVIVLPVGGVPVPVDKEDYAFLKRLEVFTALCDTKAVVVGAKLRDVKESTSEPEPPAELKNAATPNADTVPAGPFKTTLDSLESQAVTILK